ncbi:hypothetical protein BBJ28_00022003 [Nothophytophthora sp. Chile5]|nr:hypothetical protein BBJ28_00022003 [Nothophytophthora sp. Chile5]
MRLLGAFLDGFSDTLTLARGYLLSDGSLRLLQYLAAHERPTADPVLRRWALNDVVGYAVAKGDLETLQWLLDSYMPDEFLTKAVAEATSGGHLHVLEWLWANYRSRGYWGATEMERAVRNKHSAVVAWLRDHTVLRPEFADTLVDDAVCCGDLATLQWLIEHFDVDTNEALTVASRQDQWDIVRWIVENCKLVTHLGGPYSKDFDLAAGDGNLEFLKFATSRKLWTPSTRDASWMMSSAAAAGHLDVVKWLHEELGTNSVDDGYVNAAMGGHLEVLKYLHEKHLRNGSKQSPMDVAAKSGFLDVVQWLHENRSEECTSAAMHHAAVNGHMDVVKWLHSHRSEGCKKTTLVRVAEVGNLEMVQWLHDNRREVVLGPGAMDRAATLGHLDVVKWLHESRDQYNSSTLPPGVDSSVLNGAELVAVEVTETTAADGTTSYSYAIITKTGDTEQAIAWQPETTTSTSRSAASGASSALSDANTSESSNALGMGALAGIIAGAIVFIVVLFAFFIAQRRRIKRRLSEVDSVDLLESPVVGKQTHILGNGQSPVDTEYSRTTAANSRSSGGSVPDGRRRRSTLWEDSVIVAARIPIDRIGLGAIINRGGFGEVYRGRYRDQDVAIKALLPEKRKDLKYIEAFLGEVRLMATMDHPQIVQFIGVAWESLSDLYCVTEFMAGGDLRSLLKGYLANGVPQGMDATKVQIAYQVAHALTYLHSLDPVVLHRDLKSGNILLTTSLDAKLTDFGVSRVRSDATMTAGVGSSLWMAPEVMMGKRYDQKADVFSFGVVLSELDTHELPYSHAKENSSDSGRPLPDTAVLQMVSLGKLSVRFSPYMDPDMVRFAKTCVSVDPTERPTAAEVLYYLQVAAKSHRY